MKRALIFLLTIYASVPVFIYLFPWILSHVIFSHYMTIPFLADLSRPEDFLNHTRNFYLDTEEGVSVGVWHTLPSSQWEKAAGKSLEWYQETLGDGRPVIIYLHGNSETRALDYRVELVKVLSAADYHVFSFDYRGFGDSTGEPSEEGLTTDSVFLYHWVKRQSTGLICVWGHSLGSGVATNTVMKIQEQGSAVDALVLAAPFTTIKEVIIYHPLSKAYKFFPGFQSLICNSLDESDIVFSNKNNVKTLTCPLLILHAEDDDTVPHFMGVKLHEIALQAKKDFNRDVQVDMISYSADLGYAHNDVYLDPNLPNVLEKFLQNQSQ